LRRKCEIPIRSVDKPAKVRGQTLRLIYTSDFAVRF
jgi:hypothetical protein